MLLLGDEAGVSSWEVVVVDFDSGEMLPTDWRRDSESDMLSN